MTMDCSGPSSTNRLLVRTLRALSGDLDEKIDAWPHPHDAGTVATLTQHIKAVLRPI